MPIKLKLGVNSNDMLSLHPFLYPMIGFFLAYCEEYNLDCVSTSIKGDAPGRKSKTHMEGRGIDFRSKTWPEFHKNRIVHLMNEKFKDTAAISARTLKPVAVVHHAVKGGAEHFHIQCRPGKLAGI